MASVLVWMRVCMKATADARPNTMSHTRGQVLPKHIPHPPQQPLLVEGWSGLTLAGRLEDLLSGTFLRPWLQRIPATSYSDRTGICFPPLEHTRGLGVDHSHSIIAVTTPAVTTPHLSGDSVPSVNIVGGSMNSLVRLALRLPPVFASPRPGALVALSTKQL